MRTATALFAAAALAALPAIAQAAGDPAKGKMIFNQCKACHSIIGSDGTPINKGGMIGPNLYGVVGRQAGTYPKFNYSNAMKEAGQKGLHWNEADFVKYVANPEAFLKDYTKDPTAHAKMMFHLTHNAEDVWAYLQSVGPKN
ncbi:MAG: c-type cytochrome [Paracoccaceae bacterium]|nr:c-type cytochrome [Paracoccaceae bacterium]MDE3238325.1 c-type cytochrome [Paracoccaceae bacterium]